MTAPATLFRPFARLVKITLLSREFEVPENNTVLRCFQYLTPEGISYGRFCWNEDCQYCRVGVDQGEGTPMRKALACKLMVSDGLRITEVTPEIRYCLRDLLTTENNPITPLAYRCGGWRARKPVRTLPG